MDDRDKWKKRGKSVLSVQLDDDNNYCPSTSVALTLNNSKRLLCHSKNKERFQSDSGLRKRLIVLPSSSPHISLLCLGPSLSVKVTCFLVLEVKTPLAMKQTILRPPDTTSLNWQVSSVILNVSQDSNMYLHLWNLTFSFSPWCYWRTLNSSLFFLSFCLCFTFYVNNTLFYTISIVLDFLCIIFICFLHILLLLFG